MKGHLGENVKDQHAHGRMIIVLATIVINICAVALLTFMPWSDWRTGLALNLFDNLLLLGFVLRHRDIILGRLLLFGLTVGFAELAADAWLVDHTRTLDYSIGGGPMLWRSPIWMPLAWEIVGVQFGYVGLWLWRRFDRWGLIAIGLLGAINIPYYEEMARRINWWEYSKCRMLSNTPYYIILGEFGIAILLAILAKRVVQGSLINTVWLGLAGGAGIFICYAVAYGLTDGSIPH
ncbi:MAG: conserved membrane protein of unknown function [Nitrospira sp.]|nr:MAG: conserved membrane protein of unknown function [Nitrospira sp.]